METIKLLLILLMCLLNINNRSYAQDSSKVVIAIIDSGIDTTLSIFKEVEIISFDLTGEGIQDDTGHGTSIAEIAISGIPASFIKILNIKVLDKYGETDELKILKAMKIAADNNAFAINLSVGMWLENEEEALTPCRKFNQIVRRIEEQSIVSIAAGNEGVRVDTIIDKIWFPVMCGLVEIPKDLLNIDFYNDAIFYALNSDTERANNSLIKIISNDPEEHIEEKSFNLRKSILLLELAINYRLLKDMELYKKYKLKALEYLDKKINIENLENSLETNIEFLKNN